MTENTYIVTVKRGVDAEEFCHEMESDTTHTDCGCVIDRPVTVEDRQPNSLRCHTFALTDEEVQTLYSDPRVLAVETELPDDAMALDGIQTSNFSRGPGNAGSTSDLVNWGLRRCSAIGAQDDIVASGARTPYGSTTTDNWTVDHTYNIDGTGVDIVIQDNGVLENHPEWLDENGQSRFVQHDWYAAAGVSGTMPSSHYNGVGNHGTHVAGITAGRTYGWAKGARIYSMKALGTGSISGNNVFDLIRLWHLRKPIDPRTGYRRPTIVNASWGYRWYHPGTTTEPLLNYGEVNYRGNEAISFRGQGYSDMDVSDRTGVGIMSSAYQIRRAAVDSAVEDLTDAGVIFVTAAGNYYGTIFRPGDIEYNNYFTNDGRNKLGDPAGTPIYYQRGSSPVSDDAIVVANVNEKVLSHSGNPERLNFSSDRGPRVDICAPGSAITSSTDAVGYSGTGYDYNAPYPLDPNFQIARISGTSMAAPQVTGLLALYLQLNPQATPQDCKNWLSDNAETGIMEVTAFDNYNNYTGTRGAPDKFLRNPYDTNIRTKVKQKS